MAVNKRKVLEAARKHAQKGAKEKALKEYNTLLKADPRDAKLHLEIGDAYRRWGQIDDAVAQYSRVADQYTQEGFDARAVAVYKQILNLDPKRYSAFVSLGELYQRMGLDSEAVQALQTAADGLHKEGEKRQALDLLRKMATLDPSNTTSRMKVADLLRQEGMEDEALSEYDAVAEELVRQKSTETLVTVYERVLELRPDRVDVHVSMARTLIALKQAENAEDHAKRALELEPDSTDHRELLCDIYKGLGQDTELGKVGRDLARIYRERGDEDRARDIVQRIPELGEFDVQPSGADDIPSVSPAPAPGEDFGAIGLEEDDDELLADDELLDDDEFLDGTDIDGADLEATGAELTELVTLDDPAPETPLETLEAAAAPSLEAAGSAPTAEISGETDQMFAEASVYLRYGKRDEAVENLRAVLQQDPAHPGALEKLAEAMAAGDENEEAVDLWMRAGSAARAAGDEATLTRIHDRVAELDPDQATMLLPEPVVEESPQPASAATAASEAPAAIEDTGDAEFEVEIDFDMDLEVANETDSLASDSTGSAESTVPSLPDEEASEERADANELTFGSDENDLSLGGDSAPSLDGTSDSPTAEPALEHDADGIGFDILPEEDHDEAGGALDEPVAARDDVSFEGDEDVEDLSEIEIDLSPELGAEASEDPTDTDVKEPEPGPADVSAVPPDATHGVARDSEESDPSESPAEEDGAAGALESSSTQTALEPDAGEDSDELDGSPKAEPEAAAAASPSPLEGQSSTTTQQVKEELDEAEFYFEQEMFEEAETLYRKVLSIAPNHPSALLRLGELAVRRGADPSEQTPDPSDATSNLDGLSSPTLDQRDEDAEAEATEAADDRPSSFEVLASHEGMDRVDETLHGLDLVEAPDRPEALDLPDDFNELSGDLEDLQVPGADTETQPELPPAPDLDDVHDLVDEADGADPESTTSEVAVAAGDGFDLAAELRDSLSETASGLSGVQGVPAGVSSTVEEGFESIFQDFKRGVSETLADGDVDTRYDLGIAYKEMGLLEDALAEFQLCLDAPERRLQALHMLGLCALELGRHGDAVHHLKQALSLPDVLDEQRAGIDFDLGRAHQEAGEIDAAREAFESVRSRDPSFPDVDARIASLDDSPNSEEAEEAEEHFESFDDLVAEAERDADATPPAPEPEKLESFEDWIDEVEDAPDDSSESAQAEALPETSAEPAPETSASDSESEPEPTPPRKKRISFV